MSIQIQYRGGTTDEHLDFIGASRELTIDLTKNTVVVHDGTTVGGHPIAKENLENVDRQFILAKGIASASCDNFTESGMELLFDLLLSKLTGSVIEAPLDEMSGFFKCDGCEVSRADYSRLFNKIGTKFGAGDGETTFNIPDYRDVYFRGLGSLSAQDFNTIQLDAIPNIAGIFSSDITMNILSGPFKFYSKFTGQSWDGTATNNKTNISFDPSIVNPAYGRDKTNEVRTKNMAMNRFIKY